MILADKIIQLRKKSGWSQEELAEQMNVSRQAVCKWECAQSVPDLNKIIQLSQLFGVTTDYLLKDEVEEEIYTDVSVENLQSEQGRKVRYISMEEANSFLKVKFETTGRVALGVFLCILSPVVMFLLAGAAECNMLPITEDAAGAIGMVVLLLMVAVAVGIFIYIGMQTSPYEYLEKEIIETQYGVTGMVKERKAQFRDTYIKYNIIGVILCVLAVLPLFGVEIFATSEFMEIIALCVLFFMVSIGVVFLIKAGIPWESMNKLLQEGDYSVEEKDMRRKKRGIVGPIAGVYWLVVTAIFLALGLSGNDWQVAEVFWPVAGVLFGAVVIIAKVFVERKK